jgi:hypothetical protein
MSILTDNDVEMPEAWENLSSDTQDNLIKWYNVCEEDLDADDLEKLADLYNKDQIRFDECFKCGMTCYEANPDDWGEFQGTGVGMEEGIFGEACGDCMTKIRDEAERANLLRIL